MNKKVMALAVAGAFAVPAAAYAQASNVQIYGTMYMEYSYGKQGVSPAGNLINADVLQTPGSEIGIKGEEALGGGLTSWFQCASTAEIRGSGVNIGTNSGTFCGRNSALGMKGNFGNVFFGNWDSPMKASSGSVRLVSETGAWGTQAMILGGSTSLLDAAAPTIWSRRQNSTINYLSPVWGGFQLGAQVSTIGAQIGATTGAPIGKARMWSTGGTYNNGPLTVIANYERHNNFNPLGLGFSGSDNGWDIGGAYQFGPVKVGLMYAKQVYDGGASGVDASATAWNLAADWKIQGPHELLVSYTKANNTSGTFAGALGTATTIGNRVYNAGAGATGGSMWTIEYQYWLSKRTRLSAGYAAVSNDANGRYAIGGYTTPIGGQNQSAFITSMKTTF